MEVSATQSAKSEPRAVEPIDTAPHDGSCISVRYEDGAEEDGVYWSDTRYCMIGPPQGSVGPGWMSTEAGLPVQDITHWFPDAALSKAMRP